MILCLYIIAIVLGFSAPFIYAFTIRLRKYDTLSDTSVIAQYDPPFGLTAAEVGYIYDNKLGDVEIWATLFQLEQRGIISLTVQDNRVRLEVITQKIALKAHESYLLKRAHKKHGWVSIESNQDDLALFSHYVQQNLKDTGFIRDSPLSLIFMLLVFVSAGILLIADSISQQFAGQSINSLPSTSPLSYILAPFFVILLIYRFFGERVERVLETSFTTKKLRQSWPYIEGYRLFIEKTDLTMLTHSTATTKVATASSVFPYVLVLNLYPDWQELFAE